MSTQGPLGGTGSAPSGGWTTPTNIAVTDGVYTTQSVPSLAGSTNLVSSSFGFSIPVGSTINGITVAIVRHASGVSSLSFGGTNGAINITKVAGTATGTTKTDATTWGTTDATTTFGSASDLWGLTWSVSDINSSGFGIVCAVDNANGSLARTASIDSVLITVTFTPPAATATSQMFNMF